MKTSQPRTSTLPTATPLPLPGHACSIATPHTSRQDAVPGFGTSQLLPPFSVPCASPDLAVRSCDGWWLTIGELTANCLVITERSQGRRGRLQTRHPQCRPHEDLHGPDRLPERYVQQLGRAAVGISVARKSRSRRPRLSGNGGILSPSSTGLTMIRKHHQSHDQFQSRR